MTDDQISQSVAIIGMSGRFPGAESISEFWKNLLSGTCSLELLRDDALKASGVPDEIINSPRCIKRAGILHNSDMFDAPFFNYSRREAELIDPQQRPGIHHNRSSGLSESLAVPA
jgi:acyl transferase domain-containing protein